MGTNIGASIEVKKEEGWECILHSYEVGGMDRDSYSAFLGTGFIPFDNAIPTRGLPDNPSEDVKKRVETYQESYDELCESLYGTWAYYSEIRDIEWNEKPTGLDERVTIRDENGEYQGKGMYPSIMDSLTPEKRKKLNAGEKIIYKGSDGNTKHLLRESPTRRQALNDSWENIVFTVLPLWADKYGKEKVRVVFWK